jgi:hypothetical protein
MAAGAAARIAANASIEAMLSNPITGSPRV